jgi:PASTA domain
MAEERDPTEHEQPVPSQPAPEEPEAEPGATAPMDAVPDDGADRTMPMAVGAAGGPAADADADADGVDETLVNPRWSARAAIPPGGVVPVRDAAPDWEATSDPYGGRSWFTPIILALVALVLIVMLVVGLVLIYRATHKASIPQPGSSESVPAAPTTTPPARPSVVPTTTAPSPTAAAKVAVPGDLVGKTEAAARTELAALGLVVQVKPQQSGNAPPGTVLSTDPGAGVQVDPGSTVVLVVATAPPPPPPPSPTPTAS